MTTIMSSIGSSGHAGISALKRSVNGAHSAPLGGVAAFLAIVGFAFFSGGYFPRSWGVGAALLAAVAAAAIYRGLTIGRLDRAYAFGIVAVLILTAISLSWTESVTLTMLELERTLVYAVFVGAAVILVRRSAELVWALVGATTAVASWAITEHLLLDRDIDEFQGALLTGSLGYANALAAISAMGSVAAASCSVNGRRSWIWAAAAQVLLAAVALSGSRGGAVAWAVGAVVAVILARARLQLFLVLAYLAFISVGIGFAARATGVTRADASTSDVVREARLLFLLICVAAVTAAIAARLTRRLHGTQDRRRVVGFAALVLCIAILFAGLAQPSLGDRRAYWGVAVDAFSDRPILGHGPGTYERLWLERRPVLREVRDAHSLYLETFAEQGVVGGVLLVSVMLLPLASAWRGPRGVITSAAAGAYVTFLVHAGIDWDWELPAVTCAGFAAGVACLKLSESDPSPLTTKARLGLVALLVVVALGSLYALAGNWKVSSARDELLEGRPASALTSSAAAARLQPWSSEPLMIDAQSRLMLGDRRSARRPLVKAISRDPTNWLAWWLLSVSSESANERRLAALRSAHLNPLWELP
jgi:O-antigen ligase